MDLPRRSFKLTDVRSFVRPSVRSSVTSFSRDWLISFFWFLAQRCKMIMPKMWRSPIFEKKFFPAENAGNMPEKRVFWHFLETLSLVFSDFLHKGRGQGSLKIGWSGFSWKIFFGRKNRIFVFGEIPFCYLQRKKHIGPLNIRYYIRCIFNNIGPKKKGKSKDILLFSFKF